MKNTDTIKILKALLLSSLFVVGCGKKDEGQPVAQPHPNAAVPDSPTGYGPYADNSSSWSYGATVDLKIATAPDPYNPNNQYYPELTNILQSYPTNNFPIPVQLNVNLTDHGDGRNSGHIQIRFYDNAKWNTMYFSAEHVKNSTESNLYDKGTYQDEYNRWSTLNGKQVFSGYFQGGIMSNNGGWLQWMTGVVLVINNVNDQGDAQGSQYVDGEIWYRNLQTYNTGASYYGDWWNYMSWAGVDDGYPERKCWFIYKGPLQCRSNAVMNKTSLDFSADGYRKLGTFKNLPRFQAFNLGN